MKQQDRNGFIDKIFNSAYQNSWIRGMLFEDGVIITCSPSTTKEQVVKYMQEYPDIKIRFVKPKQP